MKTYHAGVLIDGALGSTWTETAETIDEALKQAIAAYRDAPDDDDDYKKHVVTVNVQEVDADQNEIDVREYEYTS